MTNTNRMFAEDMRKNADREFDRAEHVIDRMLKDIEKNELHTYEKIITIRDTAEKLQRIFDSYNKFILMAEVLEDAADYDEQDEDE